ncbi:hypothetical protein M5K25_000536 [Dendrobium thyrsiflorum]|uniref:DUF4283 domain-containing protein n=1 Tax=Dendrobium thyrsiflorum TaxID=117978 RepID=A0ABD0VU37_DENTH
MVRRGWGAREGSKNSQGTLGNDFEDLRLNGKVLRGEASSGALQSHGRSGLIRPAAGWLPGVLDRMRAGGNLIDREDDAIQRRRSNGELIISEGKGFNVDKLPQVEGKDKGISLVSECKTPRVLKSSVFPPSNNLDSGPSSAHNKIPTSPAEISEGSIAGGAVPAFEVLSVNNLEGDNVVNPWKKKPYIKLKFNRDKVVLLDDGLAMNLVESYEALNAKELEFSLVTKVFGRELPFHVVAWELRKQWTQFGQFHFTTLGEGWYLCSFKTLEAMERVLSGGPWFVNYHIVELESWSTEFSPNSMKGLTSPIWIRLPNLPL